MSYLPTDKFTSSDDSRKPPFLKVRNGFSGPKPYFQTLVANTKCLGEIHCRFREKQFVHSCVVRGPTPLSGAQLDIPDIRAGCSYILAALCALGVSEVYGIEHIERGYENLDAKLRALGAQIERVQA